MKGETVTVEKIVHGGMGLARSGGEVLFIPSALPGERLIVNRGEQKKNYSFATIRQILTPHEQRRTPPCPAVAAGCGGCDLQHAAYPLQQQLKLDILRELLQRQSVELAAEAEAILRPLLPAPQEFACRQRLRLAVEDGRLGFRRSRARELVEVERCLLAPPPLNEALAGLRKYGDEQDDRLLRLCSELELLWDALAEEAVLLLHLRRKPRPADRTAAQALSVALGGLRIFFIGEDFPLSQPLAKSDGEGEAKRLGFACNGIDFHFEVGGFCQVNLAQNERLVQTALEFAGVQPGETALDLYCGMGNFSIPLALAGAQVDGIEGQGAAIRSAKRNAQVAGVAERCSFRKAPVHLVLPEMQGRYDLILIDPPRSGAPQLAAELAAMTERLVYVSCDPATLVRDLDALRRESFALRAMQPVDMFPQTSHLEVVSLLEKR